MLIESLAADRRKMKEGVTLRFPEGAADAILFRVAHWQTSLREAIAALPPQERRRLQNQEMTATEIVAVYERATGECVVKDWSNMQEHVVGDDGRPQFDDHGRPVTRDVPYTPEKAVEIMANPDYEELHAAIIEAANDRARYRRDVLMESRGN